MISRVNNSGVLLTLDDIFALDESDRGETD